MVIKSDTAGTLSITGDSGSLKKLYMRLLEKRIFGIVESGEVGQPLDLIVI